MTWGVIYWNGVYNASVVGFRTRNLEDNDSYYEEQSKCHVCMIISVTSLVQWCYYVYHILAWVLQLLVHLGVGYCKTWKAVNELIV